RPGRLHRRRGGGATRGHRPPQPRPRCLGGGDSALRDPRLRQARGAQLEHLPPPRGATAGRRGAHLSPRCSPGRAMSRPPLDEPGVAPAIRGRLRALPAVEAVLASAAGGAALEVHPRPRVVEAVRRLLASLRARILQGEPARFSADALPAALAEVSAARLRPVLNATGVVLHTNLGRAPLASEALSAAVEGGRGYSNLELDLETGERGSRFAPLVGGLRRLTGAGAAPVGDH